MSDPYPWVTTDENGNEFRTHTAHEDGVDANGVEWSGWTYSPRLEHMTPLELAAEENRLDREFINVADEMWEADERARFDTEVNARADRFEEA